ncbi:hypothetical protein JCGZ_20557 [Jatropha curcas]|uniref:Uncharacterized protein n=1 Tax=Jatropha curcas TaxID=180498 RepID=A0A067JN33_JATCU|nr:uncharacterized protein LOC105645768 [Jatropha curcas]XP_020539588.1 uncharacterized protein LOC105645768 [Jatropha curcas]XP_020539589.1 uncharacterized protein LOC105645768 [Jatropha curcas]KDP25401.1 hypothetical protein JCGZ_20557 [Jatropha curcas]
MASCKTYGQKPLLDGRGLSLGNMHGVMGLKFSSLINPDLTWKKVAKGNRTSSRQARTSVSRSWNANEEMIKTDPNTMDMPFSEYEKLGISVLGCHFSENIDNVPIKKRKLVFRSISPLRRPASQPSEEKCHPRKSQSGPIDFSGSKNDLGQTIDTENDVCEKNLQRVRTQLNEREDFSGIYILASAACCDSCEEVDDHVVEISGVGESYACEGPSMENRLSPLSKRVVKDDLTSAKISIQGTVSCTSVVLAEDSSSITHNSFTEGMLQGNTHAKSTGDCSVTMSKDLLIKKVKETDGLHGYCSKVDSSFCVPSTYETGSSGLLIEELNLAPNAISLVNTTNEMLDIVNDNAKGAKQYSFCQYNELESLQSAKSVEMLNLALDSKVKCDKVFEHEETDNATDEGGEKPVTKSLELSTALLHTRSCTHKNNPEDSVDGFDKMAVEEPSDNGNNSKFSHDISAYEKASRFEVDYDSQYEDGEVRESIEYNWHGHDGKGIEAEHVDYGCDIVNFGSGAEEMMTNTHTMGFRTCSSRLKDKGAKDIVKIGDRTCSKPKLRTDKEIADGKIVSGKDDRRIGKRNGNTRENICSDYQSRVTESKTFKREFCSRISVGAFRGRNERDRSVKHPHATGQGGDCSVDTQAGSNRGLKDHSGKYHGSMSFHFRPAKGLHHLTRSRSPTAGDEDHGTRMHIEASRNLNPGWHVTLGRDRSRRYDLQVEGTVPKRRFHGFVADDHSGPSLTGSFPLFRGDGRSSTVKRRDPCVRQSHTKSSSRPRNRCSSPGNPCFRCRSKSPDFRSSSSIKMQRLQSSNERPGHLVDCIEEFRPAPRIHGSSPHNTRWFGDRKGGAVRFRERSYNKHSSFLGKRSVGRFFRQDDRFDLVDSMQGYKSLHPGRSMELDRTSGGGLRYKESGDDSGKHRNRYELVHAVKQYDMDGPVKRFRYSAVDGCNSCHTEVSDLLGRGSLNYHGRGTDSQIGDIPRGDKSPFTYPREGKYSFDSKSYGVHGGVDDLTSRRRS